MARGFTDLVAGSIVPEFPGETAEVYAMEALDSGIISSDAEDPVQSLANTLAKQVREGREKRVIRKRIGSLSELLEPTKLIGVKYRYFPTGLRELQKLLALAQPATGEGRRAHDSGVIADLSGSDDTL